MPLLTEIAPQETIKNIENFDYQRTPEISKNGEEWPKFVESIYNSETLWLTMTAKPQRDKKRKANPHIDIVDETVEAIDQLLTDKANGIYIDNCVQKSDNGKVSTSNIHQKEDKMFQFAPIFRNSIRNNEQVITKSDEPQNYTMQHEISSVDVVDANENYQNIKQAKTFLNRKTINVVNIERLQRQTIQVHNSVSIQPANSTNTTMSLGLEDCFLQDVEMTDLNNTNAFNKTMNLKTPVNNNTLQCNSAVDLDRYCLGCKRKLTLESNSSETPNAKRPRIEQPVQSNAGPDLETSNRIIKPQSASSISTVVSRNISPNPNNILVHVASDYRSENRPNNISGSNKDCQQKSPIANSHNLDLNIEIITTDRQYLSFQQTLYMKEELTTMILQSTNNHSQHIFIPRFIGKPVHVEGALKLWCEDTCTLIWLKNAITLLPIPGLVVKRQCDKFIRIQFIKAGIFIPWIYYENDKIIQVLKFMNPWAEVQTWPIYGAEERGEYVLFTVGIPFEIVVQILRRDRVMQFVMGTVRVRFFNGQELLETPHDIINGPRARALHIRFRQQRIPVQNWASRLPPHQFDF